MRGARPGAAKDRPDARTPEPSRALLTRRQLLACAAALASSAALHATARAAPCLAPSRSDPQILNTLGPAEAKRAPHMVVYTGLALAAESTLRHPRWSNIANRGPFFSDIVPASLVGNARERAKLSWGLELHHPCQVVEQPGPAHCALAFLQQALQARGGSLTVIAEAVDDLHERAGLSDVVHFHGLWCRDCGHVDDHRVDRGQFRGATCGLCDREASLWRRAPTFWSDGRLSRGGICNTTRRREAVAKNDLAVVIGCGINVGWTVQWPAEDVGTPVLILSPKDDFHRRAKSPDPEVRLGYVDVLVPAWVAEVLA